jgi:hypothetical protein
MMLLLLQLPVLMIDQLWKIQRRTKIVPMKLMIVAEVKSVEVMMLTMARMRMAMAFSY